MTAGSELQIRHRKKDKVRTAEIGDYLVVKDQFAKYKGKTVSPGGTLFDCTG